jgi:peptide/nickel transport system ATP-binding protein
MIFITHDLSLLVELADDIAVMYAGNVVEWAPAGDLYSTPRHPYTLGLLNSSPPLSGERRELVGIAGSPPDLSQPLQGCSFHARCPYALDRCSSDVPELRVLDDTGRKVACWLHDTPATVPGPLRRALPRPNHDVDPVDVTTSPASGEEVAI